MSFPAFLKEFAGSTKNRVGSVYSSIINQRNNNIIIQVRTATKKTSGSRTHMKDSAGRRLGSKKQDGQLVKPGQIIMRQRGTKFYPGENVGIGRDHTIFALEPGYVRYYLDPFHPKRKFIGIALNKDVRLPSPHWEPRMRRLGLSVLINPSKAKLEEDRKSRKEDLSLPEILAKKRERELKRDQKRQQFKLEIPKFINNSELNDDLLELAAERLVKIDGYLRGGKFLKDAQFYTTFNYNYDLKLSYKRGEISKEELTNLLNKYEFLSKLIDSKISFDAQFRLYPYLNSDEILLKQNEILNILKEKFSGIKIITKEARIEIEKLIHDSHVFDLSMQVRLRRMYLKPVASEEFAIAEKNTKKAVVIRRYNYETRKVEVITRTKEAFLPQVN
ncbi:hypothetical protein PACTADRAFT_41350 [Pachysolen tannophilus NRRL Y-2460]|uniref:Large ribosomal subunit protein bL27m n=1 Tax=Pachysolen tannophilus NRRL Y-2460 TaxID=669874 RepID=A0A1E4TX39_PACTA|nr:hypothetical protein PACTADRAFT_41350 [Pachysolen tannophilus NRRL Y-2460]